jgi:hypothetical protein
MRLLRALYYRRRLRRLRYKGFFAKIAGALHDASAAHCGNHSRLGYYMFFINRFAMSNISSGSWSGEKPA